jgi:WD40 repeat protein
MAWKGDYDKVLLGAMCDGSVCRWRDQLNNSCEKITLNPNNQYQTISCSGDGRRFAVAGTQPNIEVYDYETMQTIANLGKQRAH